MNLHGTWNQKGLFARAQENLGDTMPSRPVAVYMKASITYLNTFIFRCGSSLEDGIPSRPVAVI